MEDHLKTSEEVLSELGTSENGLSATEADSRLAADGENKLREKKKTPLAVRFLKQLADPMLIILIVAAIVSLVVAIIDDISGIAEVIIIRCRRFAECGSRSSAGKQSRKTR